MYIGTDHGQGLVIEAPQTGENVMITFLKNGSFWQKNTVAIRRVVGSQ